MASPQLLSIAITDTGEEHTALTRRGPRWHPLPFLQLLLEGYAALGGAVEADEPIAQFTVRPHRRPILEWLAVHDLPAMEAGEGIGLLRLSIRGVGDDAVAGLAFQPRR